MDLFGKRRENTSMFCFKNSAAVWKPNYAVLWDYPDNTVSEGRLIAPKLHFLGRGWRRERTDKTAKKPQINWCGVGGGL